MQDTYQMVYVALDLPYDELRQSRICPKQRHIFVDDGIQPLHKGGLLLQNDLYAREYLPHDIGEYRLKETVLRAEIVMQRRAFYACGGRYVAHARIGISLLYEQRARRLHDTRLYAVSRFTSHRCLLSSDCR